jgi:hypothetical protein
VAITVSREIFDPVGAGSTSGGGQVIQENGPPPNPWQPRPFTTKNEYIVSEAMRLMQVPADQIRQVRPPMINELFPPIYGYNDTPLSISDVLDTDRWAPQIRSWVSGTPRAPRQVDQMEDQWSSTLRGFSASPNQGG